MVIGFNFEEIPKCVTSLSLHLKLKQIKENPIGKSRRSKP